MKFKLVAIKSIAEQKNYKLNIRLFEIKYWCASVYSVCVCVCVCVHLASKGGIGGIGGDMRSVSP